MESVARPFNQVEGTAYENNTVAAPARPKVRHRGFQAAREGGRPASRAPHDIPGPAPRRPRVREGHVCHHRAERRDDPGNVLVAQAPDDRVDAPVNESFVQLPGEESRTVRVVGDIEHPGGAARVGDLEASRVAGTRRGRIDVALSGHVPR